MKLQTQTLAAILLPVLLAGPAAAQVRTILPGGYNPYIGAPIVLPGPVGAPVTGLRIELPAPTLVPALSANLAPAPAAAILTLGVFPVLPVPMIPSRPVVPVVKPLASRENVAHPLTPILPGLGAQFGTAEKETKNDWKKELGDELFDGRFIPNRKPAVDPRGGVVPVAPSRRVTLPESELEREIGAY